MTRISEKVKDLIEVCSYESVLDFRNDASETLKGYHFTDITSQLMAAWLDALVDLPSRRINAKALAGYRGVGKSHFLSAFAAIVSTPELRSLVHDTHVAASAHHLKRRRYPVAFVRRGTKPTLEAELREAVSIALDCTIDELPKELGALMAHADQIHSDVPFVVIVDTALERENRVSRDDGVFLGDLATAANDKNIFIGVALDDDITDADGINSAIAQSYTIDYLDQEHLYRIVDSHIFRKHRQSQSLIKDIYHQFRETLPAFKWSEPRFTSLYPLHPAILEVAPFIRLYAPEFALLGFASEAGSKILGRPANSLIALDEVFDKVEDTLRKAPDLKEAFETYDAISKEVVSLIPVMQRLQAKLILKALFVLSLDGEGTTASEISAAMLIFDESDPQQTESQVAELLETFVSIFPDELHRREEAENIRFSFKFAGKDDLLSALSEATQNVPPEIIPQMLSRVGKERFSDWSIALIDGEQAQEWTDCQVVWRGGQRRGRVSWRWGSSESSARPGSDSLDLDVFVCDPTTDPKDLGLSGESFCWKPAELTPEEIETVCRYHLLLHDEAIKEEFSDQIRAAGHTHAQNLSRIWERVFLENGSIYSADGEYGFGENCFEAQTVGDLLAACLETRFEENFPQHPVFEEPLELRHVALLVSDLFSGAKTSNSEVQALAAQFGWPLGVVSDNGDNYLLAKEEEVFELPYSAKVLELLEKATGTVTLSEIYETLRLSPFGLVKEAQQLILSALVAHRKAEFVTTKGDRINRRSLDLKIIWDDIAGIAKPEHVQYASARLNQWAQAVTGFDEPVSIDKPDDRAKIKEGLAVWLADWEEANIVSRFAGLPDELLNTRIWQISVSVERAFGNVAESLRGLGAESITLEEALERIADSFADSDTEYAAREGELVALISFIKSASLRESVWGYIAVCELTDDGKIEDLRKRLLELMDSGHNEPNAATNREITSCWKEFLSSYSEYFAVKHDSIMKSHQLQEKFDEYTKSDEWWEFERLSSLPVFQNAHWKESERILRQLRELDCSFAVRENLKNHPFCACSFNLSKMGEWEDLPDRLTLLVDRARASYRKTLDSIKPDVVGRLEQFVREESSKQFVDAAAALLEAFEKQVYPDLFSTDQLTILQKILNDGRPTRMAAASLPDQSGVHSADSLRSNLGEWLDDLPAEPVLIKLG